MAKRGQPGPGTSFFRKAVRGATIAALGFAATALPVYLLLRRELRDSPEAIRRQGWPIQLMQVLFARYVNRWIDVEGMENLPRASYIVAANHAYKSGVDGFILGHLLATRAGRVPRIVMTSDSRNWVVRAERWVLYHYGIALLVAGQNSRRRRGTGMSDTIAGFLRQDARHSVLIFPAGRAIADPALQLRDWSTGAVVAAHKSSCSVVPVAIGGLNLDWTPETVVFAAIDAALETDGSEPPFRIHVRIGNPIMPTGDPQADLEELRDAVASLMQSIPGLRPAPDEADPAFGKLTLRDGRTLAYMDRGPRAGTPVLYFHGFQGSRLEWLAGLDDVLTKLEVRLISPDRPGIGLSTPARDRTLADWAADMRQLTGNLFGAGEPFRILGFSAGATYALACGRLPGLRAMSLVCSLGLPHFLGTWPRYTGDTWRILLSAKLANFRAARFLKIERRNRDRIFTSWDSYFRAMRHSLTGDDQRIVSQPEVEEAFRQNRRESYAHGPGYLLQEVQTLYSDPQVDLSHLAAGTVRIIHGASDTVVPIEVARDLHRGIPGSHLTELAGRGHCFLYCPQEMESILAELCLRGR